jgi:hypothetical protein
MARCYANENFPLPAVEALRRLRHEFCRLSRAAGLGKRFPMRTCSRLLWQSNGLW